MEIFFMFVGLMYVYTLVHLVILQSKSYKDRTVYEKVVTWFAFVFVALSILSNV